MPKSNQRSVLASKNSPQLSRTAKGIPSNNTEKRPDGEIEGAELVAGKSRFETLNQEAEQPIERWRTTLEEGEIMSNDASFDIQGFAEGELSNEKFN